MSAPKCKCGKPAVRKTINARVGGEDVPMRVWAFKHHTKDCPRKRAERAASQTFKAATRTGS